MNYKEKYKTLINLKECGLAYNIELAESYANYLYKEGKPNQLPKEYIIINGMKCTAGVNINSKEFKYHKLVDIMIKKKMLQDQF